MIDRRTLLKGSAGLAVGSALAGCSANAEDALNVLLLEGAVPSVVLTSFQKQTDARVRFQTVAQVQVAFQTLQRWQQPKSLDALSRFMPWRRTDERADTANTANLVSLGDYWLTEAIAQDLIEPLAIPSDELAQLPTTWQQFVKRDRTGQPSSEGEVWAAPYRVQPLMIVYRASQVARGSAARKPPFSSWRDLLAPELRQSIALPEHPNLVMALLQKLQNDRFNASYDPSSISSSNQRAAQLTDQVASQLRDAFNQLSSQVKTYDTSTALKALINEDVRVVVAWSGDVAIALKRYRDIKAVIPEEGTLLSADLWVQPKGSGLSEAAKSWLSFCSQMGPATELSAAGKGISPVFLSETAKLPDSIKASYFSMKALRNSEPLLPLSEPLQTAYLNLWQRLRTNASSTS
ncbi:MAG: substrate-binding domain-containing protein [Cyanobacteria bacterium P01_D01_bin.1]